MLFRTRDLLVRQRTQTINSVRGQLAEFGVIAAQGVASVAQLRQGVAEAQEVLPDQVVSMANLLFEQIATFNEKIAGLDRDIRARAREQEEIKRLMTIPGVGPICAMAVNAASNGSVVGPNFEVGVLAVQRGTRADGVRLAAAAGHRAGSGFVRSGLLARPRARAHALAADGDVGVVARTGRHRVRVGGLALLAHARG